MKESQGSESDLGVADIPPLTGQHIPAGEPDELHPDAAGAGSGQQPDASAADLLSGLLMVGHSIAAKRFGEHWELTPEEAKELGNAAGAVLDKYFPDLSTGPEVRLLVVAGGVYGMRYIAHKAKQAELEKAKQQAATSEQQ